MKDMNKYVKQEDTTEHRCRDCNEIIMAAKVAHPIHDGPFAGSGSGKCEYEMMPFCPKCETKPSFYGSPITGEVAEAAMRRH